jgi:hypothetical protein
VAFRGSKCCCRRFGDEARPVDATLNTPFFTVLIQRRRQRSQGYRQKRRRRQCE